MPYIDYAPELNRTNHEALINKNLYTPFLIIPSLSIIKLSHKKNPGNIHFSIQNYNSIQ